MGMLDLANIKKTFYYLKRNGLRKTWYTLRERVSMPAYADYTYVPVTEEELAKQSEEAEQMSTRFSIVVPAYRTGESFLWDLLDSLRFQSYPKWELILADATEDNRVEESVQKWLQEHGGDERVRYVKLPGNEGISGNTNRALKYASGDYIGLLDHDDVLTPDALYEMAACIKKANDAGVSLQMLYSDEDKCNSDRTAYYEPHFKEDFNFDLLLSNNFICHFLVMKSELIQALGFRKEFDGAQDYDLVLRGVGRLFCDDDLPEGMSVGNVSADAGAYIAHIPKILYHWRCHEASTAVNPQSKLYAYEAGKRALQEFADTKRYRAMVAHTEHMGFYIVHYYMDTFWQSRRDVGAMGGKILYKGSIAGGRYDRDGKLFYEGLSEHYSGYMHRAVLTQDAWAVDVRCLMLRPELYDLFEKTLGIPYQTKTIQVKGKGKLAIFDADTLPAGTDYRAVSLRLAQAIHEAGFIVLWNPVVELRINER